MRRENGPDPIALAVEHTSLSEVSALLEAASVSPTASHRLLSLAHIFDSAVRSTHAGEQSASPELLTRLAKAAFREFPDLHWSNSWTSCDLRVGMQTRWDGELYRLVPGGPYRTVSKVEFLRLLAPVIDPVLITRIGYGLGDAVELVLRRISHVVETLASVWPDEPQAAPDDEPHITEAEIEAARRLSPITEQAALCTFPERAARALAAFTLPAKRFRHPDPVSWFGPTVAVRTGGQAIAVPAGMLVNALDAISADLAVRAFCIDPTVEEDWAGAAGAALGHALTGAGHPIIGPVVGADGSGIHSVVPYSRRQALVIGFAAGLTPERTRERFKISARRIDRVASGSVLESPSGQFQIASDAEVARFYFVAAPEDCLMFHPGEDRAIATLGDLLWFARTCSEPVDLWHFARDLGDPERTGQLRMAELADGWEAWRQNGKSFHNGAEPFEATMFAPDLSVSAEWDTAAAACLAEKALLALDLPPLSEWPLIDEDSDGVKHVGDTYRGIWVKLLAWPVPVAIAKTDPTKAEADSQLNSVGEGIALKLEHTKAEFLAAAADSGVTALKIGFAHSASEHNGGPPLWIAEQDERSLVFGWDQHALEAAMLEDSRAVEQLVGKLLAEQFAVGLPTNRFLAAWNAAPPTVRFDEITVYQTSRHLPPPIRAHASPRADALHRLGRHLRDSGVEPGRYAGPRAGGLSKDHVYPQLISDLRHFLDQCDGQALLEMALNQLERATSERLSNFRQIAMWRGFPVHSNPESWRDQYEEAAQRSLEIALIVEEVLTRPPSGETQPDRAVWQEALAISGLCFDFGFQRMSALHSLEHAAITVSDRFEVEIEWSDEPTDIDARSHAMYREQAGFPQPVPIGAPSASDDEDPKSIPEMVPDVAGIDSAMRASLGFGFDALFGVLKAAISWEVTDYNPVGTASASDIAAAAVAISVGASEDECQRALERLTLRGPNIAADRRDSEYWETERRDARVAVRPFVEQGDELLILPWTADMALRIYGNYLGDGRLPWPDDSIPNTVTEAMDRYRQDRNLHLERDCTAALQQTDLIIRSNVKPHKARKIGIVGLPGKIDLLCLDADRPRIWVMEVKDKYTPYYHQQARRLFDDYHKEGGHVDKLLAKTEAVRNSTASLAQALGVDNPERSWDVVPLFVTRFPTPAAFAVNPRVPFCLLNDAVRVTTLDALPPPGFCPPAAI